MNPQRFDAIARAFSSRRLSRRRAWQAAGGALAATALAAPVAGAQDATPASAGTSGQETTQYLFVQSFRRGEISPVPGGGATFTLTLEEGLGQTIFFSNRPERHVGTTPTPEFLKGMPFKAENPPNAALVLEEQPGDIDIAVLELTNPHYDTETNTATYDATPLKDYQSTLEMGFQEAPTDPGKLASKFGTAHLLIDDCPDSTVICDTLDLNYPCPNGNICGIVGPMGFCYSLSSPGCYPCQPYDHQNPPAEKVYEWWGNYCNANFPICNQDGRPGCGADF